MNGGSFLLWRRENQVSIWFSRRAHLWVASKDGKRFLGPTIQVACDKLATWFVLPIHPFRPRQSVKSVPSVSPP